MANPMPQPDTEQDGQAVDAMGAPGDVRPVKVERTQADIAAALAGVIGKLQLLADNQVQAKQPIEQRWLDDLRQYHGRYSAETEQLLKDSKKSKLFVNLTRAKVNQWEARLSDLLFPTDDKNWGIKAVPSPHLSEAVKQSLQIAQKAAQDATAAHQGGNPDQGAAIAAQGQTAADAGASIEAEIEAGDKSAGLMEAEIDSQLKDSDYNIRTREALRNAIKLGTLVMKGPVTNSRVKRAWIKAGSKPQPQSPFASFQGRKADLAAAQSPDAGGAYDPSQGAGAGPMDMAGSPAAGPLSQPQPVNLDAQAKGTGYVLDLQPDPAPEFVVTDPWNYFPDMSANSVESKEFDFERHLWNNKQLRHGVKAHGLNPEAVADLLREGARTHMPSYWAQLRQITANSSVIGTEKRFHVWEFSGVLEDEDLQALADASGDQTVMEFVTDNPLLEVPVIIWFCQGKLLKFAPYPLDSCESLYSIMPFEEDETSLFGFGVPYLMHDSQSALNGAWRMMMDNGGLSVGPQIVVDQDIVTPSDGDWALKPMKVWLKSSSSLSSKLPDSYKAFEAINITANQAQLQAIIGLAQEFADTETSMPQIAAGGMDAHVTKTTGGMSMLMNSANVVFRRVVKNFDDKVSTPNIRRIYDWNMQFNQREDIKGNYAIDARGSSVLLVKEMQTQTLMSALMNFSNHPVLGPGLKPFPLLRKLFAAQMIRADEAVKSDEQIEQEAQQRAQAAQQQQPQQGKSKAELDAEVQIAREANQAKILVAQYGQQTALIELAQQRQMGLDELQTQLQINQNDIQHRERVFAAELATQTPEKPPHDFAGPGIDTGPSGA